MLNPSTISKLQQAVKEDKYETYKVYSDLINNQSKQLMTLRGMFKLVDFDPIPIEEVEPWTEIVKRFKTGAMSYGSISKEAHENLAIAMNRIGGKVTLEKVVKILVDLKKIKMVFGKIVQ